MTEKAQHIKDVLERGKHLDVSLDFQIDPKDAMKMAENLQQKIGELYPYVEFKQLKDDIEKIKTDRLQYGYDSLCLRIDQLVTELAEMAFMIKGKSEGNDIAHYKRYYGMRAIRIYEILDDLLDGKGHTDHGRR